MPSAVGRALNAATGEIGNQTLWEAAKAHADRGQLKRYKEIRRELKAEIGSGNIVKGPRADEFKKRLQAEGLLPMGKAKSVVPIEKPDSLYGAWDKDMLQKHRSFILDKAPAGTKRNEQIERIDNELAIRDNKNTLTKEIMEGDSNMKTLDAKSLALGFRRENNRMAEEVRIKKNIDDILRDKDGKSQVAQLQSALELGTRTRSEVGRDLSGLKNEAKALRSNLKRDMNNPSMSIPERLAAMKRVKKLDKALLAGTKASDDTQYVRESAKDIDKKIIKQGITQQTGDKNYDWDSSTGTGTKKLGSGAFGSVVKEPGNGNAVKRGDIGVDEARLIDKVGKAGLGPSLKAAELDGEGMSPNTRVGRMAMSVLPGKPMGDPAPDKEINGVKVADAYWKARADLHRLGVAHNDMHGDNVFIDKTGRGKFVDMGLAQDSRKAALAEAMGIFTPPAGASADRQLGVRGDGDWQMRRWTANGGDLLRRGEGGRADAAGREKLAQKAPLLSKVVENKPAVMFEMKRDGFTNRDIATIMDHGIRAPKESYEKEVWAKMSDDQAKKYIDILYDGV
jgi:hypothetical protein